VRSSPPKTPANIASPLTTTPPLPTLVPPRFHSRPPPNPWPFPLLAVTAPSLPAHSLLSPFLPSLPVTIRLLSSWYLSCSLSHALRPPSHSGPVPLPRSYTSLSSLCSLDRLALSYLPPFYLLISPVLLSSPSNPPSSASVCGHGRLQLIASTRLCASAGPAACQGLRFQTANRRPGRAGPPCARAWPYVYTPVETAASAKSLPVLRQRIRLMSSLS
jgi:hypothetical protein